jgi:hypothetical protein
MKKTKYFLAGAVGLSWVAIVGIVMMSTKTIPPGLYLVLVLLSVLDAIIISSIFVLTQKELKFDPTSMPLHPDLPYEDRLIRIDEQGIIIKLFHFPIGATKIIFSNIETVKGYTGGCFRMWGTGDFRTWFGLDWRRPSRAMTFVILPKKGKRRIGFTAEDSATVAAILRERNLLAIQDNSSMG